MAWHMHQSGPTVKFCFVSNISAVLKIMLRKMPYCMGLYTEKLNTCHCSGCISTSLVLVQRRAALLNFFLSSMVRGKLAATVMALTNCLVLGWY